MVRGLSCLDCVVSEERRHLKSVRQVTLSFVCALTCRQDCSCSAVACWYNRASSGLRAGSLAAQSRSWHLRQIGHIAGQS
jgi:hypothetical protein